MSKSDSSTAESDTITTSVTNCSRCGKDHPLLFFRKIVSPIADSDGTLWTHWSLCPNFGEPILMKVADQ